MEEEQNVVDPKFGDIVGVWVPEYERMFIGVVESVHGTFCIDASVISGPVAGLQFTSLTHEFTIGSYAHPYWVTKEQAS